HLVAPEGPVKRSDAAADRPDDPDPEPATVMAPEAAEAAAEAPAPTAVAPVSPRAAAPPPPVPERLRSAPGDTSRGFSIPLAIATPFQSETPARAAAAWMVSPARAICSGCVPVGRPPPAPPG